MLSALRCTSALTSILADTRGVVSRSLPSCELLAHSPVPARAFRCSAVSMGGDCCGADTGVQALTLEDRTNGAAAQPSSRSHADFVQEKQPFYAKRIQLFEKYQQRERDKREQAAQADVKCKVVLPDGGEKEAVVGVTTPMDIAKSISSGLAKKVVVAHVDDKEWDVNRPFLRGCTLKLFGPDSAEGMDVCFLTDQLNLGIQLLHEHVCFVPHVHRSVHLMSYAHD